MSRYIDADKLHPDKLTVGGTLAISQNQIAEQPTADVRENVRGKWELAEDGWFCTSCEMYAPFDCDPEEKGIPYCPWCGASMLKGEKDGRFN